MKYNRILGLLAMVTAAMVGLTASASATTLTDSAGNGTPTVHLVNENAHMELANPIVDIRCLSTIEFFITSHGTSMAASGPVSALAWSNCTNEWVVDVNASGSFSVTYTGGGGAGVGTLTSSGMKITATRAGLSCIYETSNTTIGTLTGGTPATVSISANIPRVGGSFLCGGATSTWKGSWVTTGTIWVHP